MVWKQVMKWLFDWIVRVGKKAKEFAAKEFAAKKVVWLESAASQEAKGEGSSQGSQGNTPDELSDEEKEICGAVKEIIGARYDSEDIHFRKNSDRYVDVCCGGSRAFRFKVSKKLGKYFIVDDDVAASVVDQAGAEFSIDDCTEGEGGEEYKRIFFSDLAATTKLREYMLAEYEEAIEKEKRAKEGLPLIISRSRRILQMDDDGNVIAEYQSLGEAVKKTGVNSTSIRNVAAGAQKHAGGYVWKWKEG